MTNTYEQKLGTQPMIPLLIRMSLPAIAAQLINLLYNIVDRIYIGRIPHIGTDALAGIGITSAIIILITAFSSIVGTGGAPLASMALGQNHRERAGRILGNGFILLIFFGLTSALLTYMRMYPLLFLIGASGQTIDYAADYLSIYLTGTLFMQVSVGLNSFISLQGNPRTAMYTVLCGAIINIILDPIFIFLLHMGVKGAALATVISQACSACITIGFLTSETASLRLKKKYFKVSSINSIYPLVSDSRTL